MAAQHAAFGQLVAVEVTELPMIDHNDLETFMQEHPHTGIKVLKGISTVLSIRLKHAIDKVVKLS